MDPITASGLVTGIKAAIDMIDSAVSARDKAKANQIRNELQDHLARLQAMLFDAQQQALSLGQELKATHERIEVLERAAQESEAHQRELDRYDLVVTPHGPVVYRTKPGIEPVHYRCPSCVKALKPGYLQPGARGVHRYFICPDCRFEYQVGSARKLRNNHPAGGR